jgi:hypothetical protein
MCGAIIISTPPVRLHEVVLSLKKAQGQLYILPLELPNTLVPVMHPSLVMNFIYCTHKFIAGRDISLNNHKFHR